MSNLNQKKIVLGICGSIAAYKSAIIIRHLIKAEAEVKVILTASASQFITPLTLSTLSKTEVITDLTTNGNTWNNHVELGLWADAFVIAPASANTIGKMANGICDNMLLATYFSAKCPVFFAPAMDLDMWKHKAVKRNIELLHSAWGVSQRPMGRWPDGRTGAYLTTSGRLFFLKMKILITAGPTHEPIDPVRFIGNHSSGKMGIAIADEFAAAGNEIILIKGPTHLQPNDQSIKQVYIQTAAEMFTACSQYFDWADVIVFAAAVADYTPKFLSPTKIKKNTNEFSIELIKTKDIAAELGMQKRADQIIVGFALETDNEESNARDKLWRKNFDFIVLNSMQDEGAGFQKDTNKITIIDRTGNVAKFDLKSKKEVAKDIVHYVSKISDEKSR